MSTLKIDSDGDIDVSNNSFSIIDSDDYIRQNLLTKLQIFKGESFLNLNFGVPYFQEIFIKNIPVSRIESVFKEQILQTTGVVELQKFSLDRDGLGRELRIEFTVLTKDGVIELSEVLV